MRKTVILALVCVTIGVGLYAQADSDILPELYDVKVDNCGLNAALFLLYWFDLPVGISQLQSELRVGPHWELPTSMLLLKKEFEVKGLTVNAYKDATLDEVLASVDDKHVCLLHVNIENSKEGHFYLVTAVQSRGVLLVDAMKSHDWIQVDDFKNQFAKSFSGYYLSVSRSPSPRAHNDQEG